MECINAVDDTGNNYEISVKTPLKTSLCDTQKDVLLNLFNLILLNSSSRCVGRLALEAFNKISLQPIIGLVLQVLKYMYAHLKLCL